MAGDEYGFLGTIVCEGTSRGMVAEACFHQASPDEGPGKFMG